MIYSMMSICLSFEDQFLLFQPQMSLAGTFTDHVREHMVFIQALSDMQIGEKYKFPISHFP